MNSKEKLAKALEEYKEEYKGETVIADNITRMLTKMIERAKEGYYSDYDSPIATPCIQLVKDLDAIGAKELSKRARDGEFDATKEESDAWWLREGKQVAIDTFGSTLADALFGEDPIDTMKKMKKDNEELESKQGIKSWDFDNMTERTSLLTFEEFSATNELRCEQAFKHPVNKWSINDWATATGGEIGEAIQELGKLLTFLDTAKKIKRLEDEPLDRERLEQLLDQFAEELADIITYADLTLSRIRRNTAAELIKKFNKVSDKRGCPIKL
jgi:hypothetical protein